MATSATKAGTVFGICAAALLAYGTALADPPPAPEGISPEKKALWNQLAVLPTPILTKQLGSDNATERHMASDIFKKSPATPFFIRQLWRLHAESTNDLEITRRLQLILDAHRKQAKEMITVKELQEMLCDKGPIPWFDTGLYEYVSRRDVDRAFEDSPDTEKKDGKPYWEKNRWTTAKAMQDQYFWYVFSGEQEGMSKSSILRAMNTMARNEYVWTVRYGSFQDTPHRQPHYWNKHDKRLLGNTMRVGTAKSEK